MSPAEIAVFAFLSLSLRQFGHFVDEENAYGLIAHWPWLSWKKWAVMKTFLQELDLWVQTRHSQTCIWFERQKKYILDFSTNYKVHLKLILWTDGAEEKDRKGHRSSSTQIKSKSLLKIIITKKKYTPEGMGGGEQISRKGLRTGVGARLQASASPLWKSRSTISWVHVVPYVPKTQINPKLNL